MRDHPQQYRALRRALEDPATRHWDPLLLARESSGDRPPRTRDDEVREALAAGTPEWEVPMCTADAEALLARMHPPQRCLCVATALRMVVESTEAVGAADPGGLMLPAVCEAFEQRAQAPQETETRFVPMESVEQIPSVPLRRTLVYCMQLLLAEASPAIVAKLIGQLARLAHQGGLAPFFPLWWAACQRRLAFQEAPSAPLQ